ncbi:MAG: CHAT domain-containing protein [Saprospiraceae bacterium]|nr:CHAT domain-containing protein [Saprospiraceae bacterium]
MRYLILLLVVVCTYNLKAQTIDSVAIIQVDSLIKISRELTNKKDFQKALELNAIAEKLALEKFGKESAAYGSVCFNHAIVHVFKQDYLEAEKWYLESADIRQKVLGKEHLDYAASLNNLANLYLGNLGNLEKAETLYLEVKAIREKVLGKDHPNYATSLYNLGLLYWQRRNYEKAELLYLEAKAIQEKTLGKENSDYASSLQNLAVLYKHIGNYEKAEPLSVEAKTIWEKIVGKDHPQYAASLNNLANVYSNLGNYEKAEPLFLEAKAIREKVFGKDHPRYAASLNNISLLYMEMGNYEKAEPLCLEATAILGKTVGKDHPEFVLSLNNLAVIYLEMGNYEKAEPLFLEAKTIRERVLGKEHPDYASSLNGLANIYLEMGNYKNAELLYLEAKAIREKAQGKDHPDYAASLIGLANIYKDLGNYEKAELLYFETQAIWEKVLGKVHPDYSIIQGSLADLYERQSRYDVSAPLFAEMYVQDQARILSTISFLSERELASYTATFQFKGDNLGAYNLARLEHETIGAAVEKVGILPALHYNNALFYKGFLLTAAAQLNVITEASPELTEIRLRLKSHQRRLSTEYAKPITERKNVAELEEKANTVEKELARSMQDYAEAKRLVKWEEVMSTLKKDEAAIEFVSFKVIFPQISDSIMYAALLLKPGEKQPKFIPLFEVKSIDSLLTVKSDRKADYVNNLYTLSDRGLVQLGSEQKSLYALLWKPLESELVGVKTIYFSPSGLLHRINLDAIPISETEALADRYNLISLNSTRQLVIPTQIKNVNNNAVLYGGIQFEQDSTNQNIEPLLTSRSRGELSFLSIDTTLRGGSWNYLAGTEREVNAIEKIMQSAAIQSDVKKGYAATEESFKNIGANNNPSPRILHIATHGYFFPDPKSTTKSTGLNGEQETIFKISDHPMLRSGLIMAGGNAAWQGEQTLEGREDGILTAYEISQMNLSNTELVVLSACETGLGDIQGNEGVYGLQRAFKIAGAKYLIMSLWQVPDKQTSLLMTTFYKKWLEEKMTIRDAFHAAQKELRDIGLDPYQWAGFVLVE